MCGGDAVKLFDIRVESGDPCVLAYAPRPATPSTLSMTLWWSAAGPDGVWQQTPSSLPLDWCPLIRYALAATVVVSVKLTTRAPPPSPLRPTQAPPCSPW
ncbi:hypothetical protein PVAP13_1KG295000 [Panicum virgatum]|uniref:Uncharacterized protein n=1 Tax=Panicum virgatum TaxID=38727 RepID=A0A8T0XH12_PANVG|nr:hypothetical protein PVAP13_1KG295000 [Panicum virgatum]